MPYSVSVFLNQELFPCRYSTSTSWGNHTAQVCWRNASILAPAFAL